MSEARPNTNDHHDALIVGAGVIGLACAWRAAQRGLRVCVLERDRVASGASGVAAGMLAPVGEASWGEEPLLRLGLASLEMWEGFAAELEAVGGPTGYARCGALHVALDRDEAAELRRRHELHRELGLDSEWLRPSAARKVEPAVSPSITGALHAPHEAVADPDATCGTLAAAARAAGARIETGAEVAEARLADGGCELRLADGRELRGSRVVIAAGPWSGGEWLPAEARAGVRPVKGEILTLRGDPGDPVCSGIVSSERVYLAPRADGRLIAGATVEERGFDVTVTAGGVHELLREAYRAVPEVAELEFAGARAALRPGSPDNAPLIGPVAGGAAILATGHHRNGVLLAPATGEAVAAMLAGEEPAVDVAALSPARFEPAEAPAR